MKISKNIAWLLFFFAISIFYYFVYYLPFRFSQLAGDGMCQVAYWYSLFDPVLRGSTCASNTKPGWSVLLGFCHEFYRAFNQSDLLLRLITSLSLASLVWIITRTSVKVGGWAAGICSFLLSFLNPVFFRWYIKSESYLFFLPCVMFGLWFYAKGREKIGGILLVLGIFFRIEAVLVVLFVCAFEFAKSHYKKGLFLGTALVIAILLWLCFIYIVQGDFSRLDCGAAAGYNAFYKDKNFLNIFTSTRYYLESWQKYFNIMKLDLFLFPFMLFAILTIKDARLYLAISGAFIVYFMNILFLGGTNQVSCLMVMHPFNIALGCAGLFALAGRIEKNINLRNKLTVILTVLFSAIIINFIIHSGIVHDLMSLSGSGKEGDIVIRTVKPFVINAADIINRKLIPEKSNILTEDDIIYSLIVSGPKDYLGHMTAFPYFNACSERERAAILSRTSFVYISKLKHFTFFLVTSDLVSWKEDAFREKMINLLKTREPFNVYNVRFSLIEESDYGFLIKVEHALN